MGTEVQGYFTQLSHRQIVDLNQDYHQTARIVRLQYVSDSLPGIYRKKNGKGFVYYTAAGRVKDNEELQRIKKIVIPPAWTRVWICPFSNGHLQATGYDAKGRKQYRYHSLWSAARNETKFYRLYEFGKALPALRERVEKDLLRKNLDQKHVIATVISVMERTYIRVGNEDYEKMYGSYGITTLKDNHVRINGSELRFCFKGKKGITQTVSLKNPRLARLVKQCRDIPGKELFQYYDEQGLRHSLDSGMVNDYIREATGCDFTAKDFRTWAGTLNLLRSLCSLGEAITESECKKNILLALDEVSRKLGNTRTVCRKYYVHPGLIALYEQRNLSKYTKELDRLETPATKAGLTSEEQIILRILKSFQ